MVAIHEGMTARDACVLLAERNHQDMGPNWTIIEKIPDLHLGEKSTFFQHNIIRVYMVLQVLAMASIIVL